MVFGTHLHVLWFDVKTMRLQQCFAYEMAKTTELLEEPYVANECHSRGRHVFQGKKNNSGLFIATFCRCFEQQKQECDSHLCWTCDRRGKSPGLELGVNERLSHRHQLAGR